MAADILASRDMLLDRVDPFQVVRVSGGHHP
jgi:hypothetical protein